MSVTRKRVLASTLFTLYALFGFTFLFSTSSAETLTSSAPSSPFSCQPIGWVNTVNITISGNTIQKTGGSPSTWDAGAISYRAIQSGDGYVQVSVDALDTYRMVGLSNSDSDARYRDIDFAFYLAGSDLKVYERGLYKATYGGSLNVADNLRVAVESGVVNYYINDNLVYTSSATPTYPLLVDSSINSTGGQIANAYLCGTNLGYNSTFTPTASGTGTRTPTPTPTPSCQPVAWMNLANMTATGNSVQKTGGAASTWDAGAVSTMAIQSGDGYVQATVDAPDTYRMFGLSNGDSGTAFSDIDFAAYLAANSLKVYERGLYKGTFAAISVGDTVRVAVESGVVSYYVNGSPVYTSATPPTYPLLLDAAVNSASGRVTSAFICGANLGPNILPSPTRTNTPAPATNTPTRTFTSTSVPATSTPTRTATSTFTPIRTNTAVNTATRTPTPASTNTSTRTPTRTLTRTPAPTNTPGGTGGCSFFPSDNIWYRNIASLPVHPMSAQYVASIGLNDQLHANFGSGTWDGGPIGIPYITVPGTQPRVPISFRYAYDSDPGPYPIPTDAPIEGGPNSTGDRHVIVVDRDACVSYEVFSAYPNTDGSWSAGAGARFSFTSNALRRDGWTSGNAAGLPMLQALVTYDQVQSGVIRHALRFSVPSTQAAHIWPARHHSQDNTDPNLPPMGLRVRLKASTNISGYPTQVRVLLQTMKDYGMFIADNGGPWQFDGTPDERWDNNVLHQLENLHGSDFEAVDSPA